MSAFKFLIDTNIVIGLEDNKEVEPVLAEFARKCSEFGVRIFVDSPILDDLARDPYPRRQAIVLSKVSKFEKISGISYPDRVELSEKYGPLNSENDICDARLLFCLERGAADFLVTFDIRLIRRARRLYLAARVFLLEDALAWLAQTFEPKSVHLPHIVEESAYTLDPSDPIFDDLKQNYDGFENWLEKCSREHRSCWKVIIDGASAGLVIIKDETASESNIENPGNKILKLCTFKMNAQYQVEKFGEHLLKKSLWHAQINQYDVVYLTIFPKHLRLINLLKCYGFEHTKTQDNEEVILEKQIVHNPLYIDGKDSALRESRRAWPRFYDGEKVKKYIIPIRGIYFRRLFPEISKLVSLPILEIAEYDGEKFSVLKQERTPGNTIRKVYVCRAPIKELQAGGILLFYLSKDESMAASQSITTIGVVERMLTVNKLEELVAVTAKRSVFSVKELEEIQKESKAPVKVIEFLLVGHSEPAVSLSYLTNNNVFTGRPPQSITEISEKKYQMLKKKFNLGFSI